MYPFRNHIIIIIIMEQQTKKKTDVNVAKVLRRGLCELSVSDIVETMSEAIFPAAVKTRFPFLRPFLAVLFG